ncbi:MAG: exodeoxyribonuclease V subunit gamma, partial [Acidimicrobiales bacterium]|nr:exodeoxyribonuclease V subunit gamma [Acidimicrobiales bacterium]
QILSDQTAVAELGLPLAPEASRYGVARQIADQFDRYHVHRPSMVRSWARGEEVDGLGARLPNELAWQVRLWRRVRERIGQPSPPERWPELLERLHAGALDLDLPDRLLFFGFSLLPTGDFLDLLAAVATTRDVHLFQLQPTSYDAADLLAAVPRGGGAGADGIRSHEVDDAVARHPLLRSWGRAQRESATLLADAERRGLFVDAAASTGRTPSAATLLGRLQSDVRANRAPEPNFVPEGDDRTVQFHACFGPARQVAALGDTIRHLLLDDTSLAEEDIVVLCPAIDRFAPLIEAVLGPPAPASGSEPDAPSGLTTPATAPALRYRLVDQSVRNANEVVEAALALLDLVSGRFEAPAVVDFLSRPPVRAAFHFDEADLADIDRWVVAARVRWGLDPEHRSRFGLTSTVTSNTWQAALDRLFVGSAVDADGLAVATGEVVPLPVESGSVGCLGRLAEALRLLGDLAAATTVPRPLADWVALVGAGCDRMFATGREAVWQREAVERSLADVLDAAGGEGAHVELVWADVRRVVGEYLGARRGRNDFFRGGITVTSVVPLRDVPFRVVCLLGMDQAALSGSNPSGDDLVQANPVLGDRDPRSDLRQALLAAVQAAEDRVIVLRDGHNPRTNQRVPRAVAVDELFEAVLAAIPPDRRAAVGGRLEVDHPCHPFAEACFTDGGLV